MSERADFTRELWNNYGRIHEKSPNPDSQEKAIFYSQNSDFIRRNLANSNPEIAVIIPAYNEESYLARTLASINNAFRPRPNACLLVVDNGSTDATKEIVQEFGGILVREPQKGIGQARQTGLESVPSSVKYVLTTDADTVVPPDWISRHQEALSQSYIVFTYGGFRFVLENSVNFLDKAEFLLLNLAQKIKCNPRYMVGGSNSGFIKDSAIACGGYDRKLNLAEDFNLYKRLLLAGYAVHINSEVLTSARRFIGEGPLSILSSKIKQQILQSIGIQPERNFINQYQDYRSK